MKNLMTDPHIAEIVKNASEEAVAKVDTWEGLYSYLIDQCKTYTEGNKSPLTADASIALLIGFVCALRDLPESGDCKEIIAKTIEYAIGRPDIVGVGIVDTVEATSSLVGLTKVLDALLQAVDAAEEGEGSQEEVPEEQDSSTVAPSGRTLH